MSKKILSTIIGKSNYEAVARQMFKLDGYNKLGLYHDDIIEGNAYNADVTEAYRRMLIDRPDLHDQRVYRVLRAMQLNMQKKKLPKEEWPTYEEDQTKGRYLTKYLEQIHQEQKEKAYFAVLESE